MGPPDLERESSEGKGENALQRSPREVAKRADRVAKWAAQSSTASRLTVWAMVSAHRAECRLKHSIPVLRAKLGQPEHI